MSPPSSPQPPHRNISRHTGDKPTTVDNHLYRRVDYLRLPGFPFNIWREIDGREQFGERVRARREFWKIVFIESGHGVKVINETLLPFGPNEAFLVRPEDRTTFLTQSDRLVLVNVVFLPDLVQGELPELFSQDGAFAPPGLFATELRSTRATADLRRLLRTMEREFADRRPYRRARIRMLLGEALILFARHAGRAAPIDTNAAFARAKDAIETRYAEPLALGDIAQAAGMGASPLCRLYRQRAGTTVMAALRAKRLDHAAQALRESSRPVSDICFQSGFGDLSRFYRAFRARFHTTPRNYRSAATNKGP